MALNTIDKEEIKALVRKELADIVKEVVHEEFELHMMEIRSKLIPLISQKEQDEIENLYGKEPDDFEETEAI
ncbi:MAG: hypothetical protein ACLFSQ_09725, partial [Candidatus Zixiibacteriota bacterium]